MKEKGTLLVVGSLLALSLATVTTARAAGTLNFTGKIINESCQIANNGGDVNVDFGNVDMSALKSHEAKTAETPFTINLTGCPLAQNISISLEGTPDTNANGTSAAVLALSDAADTAKGVGIEVFSYVTITTLTCAGQNQKTPLERSVIAPHSREEYSLPGEACAREVSWRILDDFGAVQTFSAPVSAH